MGKGFFKRKLASPSARRSKADVTPAADTKKEAAAPAQTPQETPDIYTDDSVCAALNVRRRILAGYRTRGTFGRWWSCVNLRAGMTRAWIDFYAKREGTAVNEAALVKIEKNDRRISVRFVARLANPYLCIVELEADGSRQHARIRHIMAHPMGEKQCFTCANSINAIEWSTTENKAKW